MFPTQDIRNRLMEESHSTNIGGEKGGTRKDVIADYFPSATVMFADIVGFTAWSSVRTPSQVFTLLETVYSSFDDIADSMKVFKVRYYWI